MDVKLHYTLTDKYREEVTDGEATGRLEEESFSIMPKFGETLYFTLRDITDISASDYQIHLILSSEEKLTLSQLGFKYEDFLRILYSLHNEMIIKDMLMNESIKKSGVEAEFSFTGMKKKLEGQCKLRLYESAIVIIPRQGDILRIPYCELEQITEKDFTLVVNTEFKDKITLSKMGKNFNPFAIALSKVINELSLQVQSTVKELVPEADPLTVRKVSRFMKEGKAARRSDIETVCPQLWEKMEKKVKELESEHEYEFLRKRARKEKMCIGLKRGLMGDLNGEYIWFLIPIYSLNHQEPGNIVAMESLSSENGGKATYFFRIVGRKEYREFDDFESLDQKVDNFITKINRCMLAINFRREPIYLSDELLTEPCYRRYMTAVSLIPELKELRKLFVGRVIHRNINQWKSDAESLLKFNINSSEDSDKWEKEK
ncbi:MAG: hypothetical protein R6V47_07765 [Candidatus Delongbacteria bacterium]